MSTTTKKKPVRKKKIERNNGKEERRELMGFLDRFLTNLGGQLGGGGGNTLVRVMVVASMQPVEPDPTAPDAPELTFGFGGRASRLEMQEHAPVIRYFFAGQLHGIEIEPGRTPKVMLSTGERFHVMEDAAEVATLCGLKIAEAIAPRSTK